MGWKDTIQDEGAQPKQGGWRSTIAEEPPKQKKGLLGRVADTIDSYTGAPVRAAIGAYQNDEPMLEAYAEQFGEDPSRAPTGVDIAKKAGVSDRPIYDVGDEEFEFLEATDPMAARDVRGLRGVSRSGSAGLGIEIAADPTNLLPMVGPAIRGASKLTRGAGKAAKNLAETQMFRALGPTKAATDRAQETGSLTKIGRDLLDSGPGLAFSSRKKLAERVSKRTTQLSDELNKLIDSAADTSKLTPEAAAKIQSAQFIPSQAADVLKAKIRKEYSHVPQKVLEQRLSVIDDWLSGSEPMNIKDAQAFKQQVSHFIKDRSYWAGNPNASQETLVGVRRSIKEGIEKNADAAAEVSGGAAGQIKETNQKLGRMLEAEDIVEDSLARDTANRMVSLTDTIAGAGGASTGVGAQASTVNGLAAMGANMLLRRFGRQASAVAADKVGSLLLRTPEFKALAEQNPKVFAAVVTQLGARKAAESAAPLAAVAENKPSELDTDSSQSSQISGPEAEGLIGRKPKLKGPKRDPSREK